MTLALLALSLCANVLLGRSLVVTFERLQFARLFPLGYAAADAQPRVSGAAISTQGGRELDNGDPAAHETIAVWGDSRAYFWDTSSLARDRAIVNFAHGAQSSAQLLLQLRSLPPTHSTYSIVQIGINDLHPLGVLGEQKLEIVGRLKSNVAAIRDELLARSERVVLTTIFPPGPVPLVRRFTWDYQTLALIEETNRAIVEAADGRRVVVLDAYNLLRDEHGQLASEYADDDFFLHVNRAAYARLNSELASLLTVQAYSK